MEVSVPIRGLFNLTFIASVLKTEEQKCVSVPIRGLFNLTNCFMVLHGSLGVLCFRPH